MSTGVILPNPLLWALISIKFHPSEGQLSETELSWIVRKLLREWIFCRLRNTWPTVHSWILGPTNWLSYCILSLHDGLIRRYFRLVRRLPWTGPIARIVWDWASTSSIASVVRVEIVNSATEANLCRVHVLSSLRCKGESSTFWWSHFVHLFVALDHSQFLIICLSLHHRRWCSRRLSTTAVESTTEEIGVGNRCWVDWTSLRCHAHLHLRRLWRDSHHYKRSLF